MGYFGKGSMNLKGKDRSKFYIKGDAEGSAGMAGKKARKEVDKAGMQLSRFMKKGGL